MITREQKEYLLPKAYNAAIRAGAAILDIYNSGGPIDVDIKSDRSPITVADRLAHSVIREYLGQTRIPLLSEEGREMLYAERKDWDLFWMVDPLDGTVEFIKGNGEFTVNIALMADNRPVFGVIYVPYRKRIYFSDSDLGAFRSCNTEADPRSGIRLCGDYRRSRSAPLTDCRNRPLKVAVSRSHSDGETARHLEELRKKTSRRRGAATGEFLQTLPDCRGFRRLLSAHHRDLRMGHGGRRIHHRPRRRKHLFARRHRPAPVQQGIAGQPPLRLPQQMVR